MFVTSMKSGHFEFIKKKLTFNLFVVTHVKAIITISIAFDAISVCTPYLVELKRMLFAQNLNIVNTKTDRTYFTPCKLFLYLEPL